MTSASEPAPRRAPRTTYRVESRVKGEDDPRFLGYLGNISETGAFIQCSRPRKPGTPVAIRLHLGGAKAADLDLEGHVIWCRGYAGRNQPSAGMGVQFRNVDATSRVALRAFCAKSDPVLGPRL